MILETERLVLREMNQDDYRDLAEILQNSNVCMLMSMILQIWMSRSGLIARENDMKHMVSGYGQSF